MTRSLDDKIRVLPGDRLTSIQKRADELVAEAMTLRDLRVALDKTQQELRTTLHMKQEAVSRLERRSDILLSTLNKYISAMGGSLKLIADFPDRPSVIIHGVADIHSL